MTQLMSVKNLLKNVHRIQSTEKPRHQGNSGAIWSIIWDGEVVKSNPIGCTLDAMTFRAAAHLDEVGIDRSQAMRFGLVFYSWLYGNWRVFPDVMFKLGVLVKDARVMGSLKGTVAALLDRVMSLVPPAS